MLRSLLASALALSLLPSLHAQTLCGVDVLAEDGCAALQGRKVGLITNHTGVTRDGRRTVDVLHQADGVTLAALFSPEHGWQGVLDEKTTDTRDEATGLRVFSLYGETRKPTDEMLEGVDTIVFDIQDIGCRFYTYVSTMRNALEAAGVRGLRFVVLDRPNPIGGLATAGPIMPKERRDFVGAHTTPVRHGMTIGELARMMVGEDGIRVDLQVIECKGWHRADLYDDTGLTWVSPSPNMRRLTQALTYPGIGLIEGTNISVGRGTDTPFEILGAPWCDGTRLAAELRAQELPGVTFVPVRFTPTSSRHKEKECSGVHVLVTDWRTFEPVRTGLHVACALRKLHRDDWQTKRLDWLLKHPETLAMIEDGKPAEEIVATWKRDNELFRMRRRPFLIYE